MFSACNVQSHIRIDSSCNCMHRTSKTDKVPAQWEQVARKPPSSLRNCWQLMAAGRKTHFLEGCGPPGAIRAPAGTTTSMYTQTAITSELCRLWQWQERREKKKMERRRRIHELGGLRNYGWGRSRTGVKGEWTWAKYIVRAHVWNCQFFKRKRN